MHYFIYLFFLENPVEKFLISDITTVQSIAIRSLGRLLVALEEYGQSVFFEARIIVVITTRSPRSIKALVVAEPIKPAPPVTRTVRFFLFGVFATIRSFLFTYHHCIIPYFRQKVTSYS
jgi:hypothetical protein